MAWRVDSSPERVRATAATLAPHEASRSAIALPIPREAPVTRATWPFRSTWQLEGAGALLAMIGTILCARRSPESSPGREVWRGYNRRRRDPSTPIRSGPGASTSRDVRARGLAIDPLEQAGEDAARSDLIKRIEPVG